MKNFVADAIEAVAKAAGNVFRTNMASYINAESSDCKWTLVADDGSYISGIRIYGCSVAVGAEELNHLSAQVLNALSSPLRHSGHTVDIFMSSDPDGADRALKDVAEARRSTAERIGLEVNDIIGADRKAMRKYVVKEEMFIVLWTNPSRLPKGETKAGYEKLTKLAKELPPVGKNSQDPVIGIEVLRDKHLATLETIVSTFKTNGILCSQMTAHEMLRSAREQMFPEETPDDWNALLPGDSIPMLTGPGMLRDPDLSQLDYSDIQQPSLAFQLNAASANKLGVNMVQMGSRIYAPVMIDVPSRVVTPFDDLVKNLNDARIPYRVMFRLDGGGLNFMATKEMVASLFSFTAKHNERIADSMDYLRTLELDNETLVRMRIAFCTWGPEGQESLVRRRFTRLVQAVTSWGDSECREQAGDVLAGVMSTVPFVSNTHLGNFGAGDLADIVKMLPIYRPASPWLKGNHLFRSLDGKMVPWQAGSSLQTTWNYSLVGRPGSGKSLQLINTVLNAILQTGGKRLPRASFLDIGASSRYFTEALRGSLPHELRHLVQGFKIKMTEDYAINVFDLPLGCRKPTREHKAMLVNIITQLATPAEMNEPYPRMSEMVSAVIDNLYDRFADGSARSNPKRFSLGAVPRVDELLEHYGLLPKSDEAVSWYRIVDELMERGHAHEAMLAQRYAVPMVSDCTNLDQTILDMYSEVKVDSGGQSMSDSFVSLMTSATRDFPNLSCPTRFDIGEARIVSADLAEVAKGTGRAAIKQTSVMYMVIMFALTKDYRLDDETVNEMHCPEQFRQYHRARAKEILEDIKWVILDEFHRTEGSPQVVDSVLIDMREGRKFGIGVILSTQSIGDISEKLRKFMTGYWICDHGGKESVDEIQRILGLNNTTKQLLIDNVTGPRKSGAPFLAHFSTKQGDFTNVLVSTLGDVTLWGLSTTAEDAAVRKSVCGQLGASRGRQALAATYPGGVKDVVETMKDEGITDPFKVIVDEVIARFRHSQELA